MSEPTIVPPDKIQRLGEMGRVIVNADVRCNCGVIKIGLVRMVGWGIVDPEFPTPRIYPMTAEDAIKLANELMRAAHEVLRP
jgi:hypothetical protein